MENICVITGASCFGMHKVVQFLDERGVSLINLQGASGKRTEKEEKKKILFSGIRLKMRRILF